jgi:hypothetical protein
MQSYERKGLVVERLNGIRPDLERAVEPGQRLFMAAKQHEAVAEIVADLGVLRIELMGPRPT